MLRLGWLAVSAAMCLWLIGCGGSSSSSSKVASVVKTYLSALANGQATRACDQLTGSEVQVLEQAAQGVNASTCVRAMNFVAESLGGDNKQALRNAKVIDVHVSGESATARLQGGTSTVHLIKTGGRWFISGGFGGNSAGSGGSAGSNGSTTGSTASVPTTASLTPNAYARRLDAVVRPYLGGNANVVLAGAGATIETHDSAAKLRAMNAKIQRMCKALVPVNTTNDTIYIDDSAQNDVTSCPG